MSKSKRALIQITLSLLLAVVAGVLIFNWTSGVKKGPATPVASTVPVVVAKADMSRGARLTAETLEVREYTADSRPSGAFSEISELDGRVLSQAVGVNEAVTALKLADESVLGGGVSALIEPGKRAMAVKGNAVMGLAGFVRPGDKVDVIVSLVVGQNDDPRTKVVLERVKVLATGTELTPPGEDGKTASVDVYTLELTPGESERLALAATRGTLHFALRNEQDDEETLTTGSDVPRTLAALRPKKKVPRSRKGVNVEVITGGSISSVKF